MMTEKKKSLKLGENLYRVVYRARLSDQAPVIGEVNLRSFKEKFELDFEKIVAEYLKLVTGGYVMLDEILSSDIVSK